MIEGKPNKWIKKTCHLESKSLNIEKHNINQQQQCMLGFEIPEMQYILRSMDRYLYVLVL